MQENNELFQRTLYELMKQYPEQDDFVKMMNASLRGAAERLQNEKEMKDYSTVLINLLQNNRTAETTTLQSFLAYWLGLNEGRSWKDMYNDDRVLDAMHILSSKSSSTTNNTTSRPVNQQAVMATATSAMSAREAEILKHNLDTSVRVLSPEMRQEILNAVKTVKQSQASLDSKLKSQGI